MSNPSTPAPHGSQASVSVIVPLYNHAPYIRQRLDSILRQTYRDFEVVLLDDCSSDGSLEMVQAYLPHPQIRLSCNTVNSGSPFKQWAQGMAQARGRYIWIAESDDWAEPNFLERLVAVLEAHPAVGLAYCQSWSVDTEGNVLGDVRCWTDELDPQRWTADYIASGQEEIRRFLSDRNTIPNASAVLLRRSALEAAGPLDTGFRLCGDWMYWIQVLAVSDIAFVSEKMNYWRSQSSHARVASNGTLEWIEGERVLRAAARAVHWDDTQTQEVLFKYLRRCWQWQREYIEALPRTPAPAPVSSPPKVRLGSAWRALFGRPRS